MSQYYLLAQLPALEPYDGKSQLPITEEAFLENCSRFLGEKEMELLRTLSLVPPREATPSGSGFIDSWNEKERQLRLALAIVRAAKLGKSFPVPEESIPVPLMQIANIAVEMGDPLQAEEYLNRCRMQNLDSLRPMDAFSEDAVYSYALRLKLLERIRQFDADCGRKSYQKIYHSILNGSDEET